MIYCLIFMMVIIAGVLLVVYMVTEAFQNNVQYHTFEFNNFPKSFKKLRLFFISDIHRRNIHSSIIKQSLGKVDFVIIGGDLAEQGVPLTRIDENLRKLKMLGPIYFIWGNNDYEIDEAKLFRIFKKYDVKMLRNDVDFLQSKAGEKIAIIGIDDISQEQDDLHKAMAKISEPCFQILLSHNPDITQKMFDFDTISFILSGHTHGGQIRILGYTPYKKGGVYKYSDIIQLVSNGYGTSLFPLRLGAKPEAHIITLK